MVRLKSKGRFAQSTVVSTYIPLHLQIRLDAYALKKGLSRNQVVRDAIEAYLNNRKKGNNKRK